MPNSVADARKGDYPELDERIKLDLSLNRQAGTVSVALLLIFVFVINAFDFGKFFDRISRSILITPPTESGVSVYASGINVSDLTDYEERTRGNPHQFNYFSWVKSRFCSILYVNVEMANADFGPVRGIKFVSGESDLLVSGFKGIFHDAFLLPVNEKLKESYKDQSTSKNRYWISPFIRFCISMLMLIIGGFITLAGYFQIDNNKRFFGFLLVGFGTLVIYIGCFSLQGDWWNKL